MTKTVTCPQCAATFEAPVASFGFLEMIERCPACGAGPITTNLAALAEDAVTIVLRAEKASDLAMAVKEFHPDFAQAKTAEVLAFARERLSSGVAFQVSSVFAEACVAAVRMTFPKVQAAIETPAGEGRAAAS